MARNGSGTMSIVNTFVAGNTITAAGHNQNNTDIANEITNSLALDGQSVMTGQLKAANGTVAAPSITFGSDLDTGFYRAAANAVSLSLGGADVVTFATATASFANTAVFSSVRVAGGFTDTLTVTNAAASFTGLEAISTDAGASGPIIRVYHNSASPAASDVIGSFDFAGKDSGGTKTTYVSIGTILTDTTDTSEDADAYINRLVAGSMVTAFRTSATGGNLTGDWTISGAVSAATIAGAVVATQANMETGTATTLVTTPGRQHFHPKAPKAQAMFNGTGTLSLAATSSGVSSVTDNGTGDYTPNWTSAFANATYSTPGSSSATTGNASTFLEQDFGIGSSSYSAPQTTSMQISTLNTSFAAIDSPRVSISAFGDLP